MAPKLSTARWTGRLFIGIYTAAWIVYAFYAVTASGFEYTYERNYKPSDMFFSQRWSAHFFYVGSIVFQVLVPLTLALALGDSKGSVPLRGGRPIFRWQIVHVIVTVLLLIWFGITTLVFESLNFARANEGVASNAFNPANDPRWCCVYFALETGCFVHAPGCNTPTAISDLRVNPLFQYYYGFGIALIVLMAVDLILYVAVIWPAFRANVDGDQTGALPQEVEMKLLPRYQPRQTK